MNVLWIVIVVIFVIAALFAAVCGWVSYKIGKCFDKFDEFNFKE